MSVESEGYQEIHQAEKAEPVQRRSRVAGRMNGVCLTTEVVKLRSGMTETSLQFQDWSGVWKRGTGRKMGSRLVPVDGARPHLSCLVFVALKHLTWSFWKMGWILGIFPPTKEPAA